MRIQRILVGAALLMLCAAAAYAQVTVSSIPVTTVISSGRGELAGAVRLSTSSVGAVADTITVRYGGLPITNTLSTAANIVSGGWACTIANTDNANGIVTVSCPAGGANTNFTLVGVRVSVDGYAGANVVVSIGTLTNTVIANQNTAVVINSIAAGLVAAADGAKNTSTAVYLANGNTITAPGTWLLTEGFASAWKNLTDAGPGATQGTQIQLTLTGLPDKYTLTPTFNSKTSASLAGISISPAAFKSTVTQLVISMPAEDPAAVETIGLDFNATFGSASLPLAAASYKVSATLAPIQGALTSSGAVITDSYVTPKFADVELPAAGFTALTISPNTTNFIIPYLTTSLGYDTGIAIANTTTDPFAVGSANKQNGAITFNFYPNDGGAVITYTTQAGSPGSGLTAGVLNSGSTYVVLAGQILAAAGRTTPFSGYAIIVGQATNMHGVFYVTNFSGFSAGQSIPILTNPAVISRATGLVNATEGVAF